MGVTILLILVQRLLTRRKGFVALTGKGGERRPIRLAQWRWALFGYAMLVTTLSVFLPYLQEGGLAAGNRAIDEAAVEAGRWDTTVIAASRAEQRCGVETPCRAPDVPGK